MDIIFETIKFMGPLILVVGIALGISAVRRT